MKETDKTDCSCCVCQNGVYACWHTSPHVLCSKHQSGGANLREVENINFIPKGWECPKCGVVNSPYQSFCFCSKTKCTVIILSGNSVHPDVNIKMLEWLPNYQSRMPLVPLTEDTNELGGEKEEGT